jgi:LmbE family N-acetylglucosaminyl deacetylase
MKPASPFVPELDVSDGPLLVISPHLDDGVFSCGGLLGAGAMEGRAATVVTVFAGRPPAAQDLTDWDRACGFSSGSDVVGCRREEDQAALELLGAQPAWIEFLDSQYGESPSREDIVLKLRMYLALCDPGIILFPLGLFHSDHRLVHEAALMLIRHARNRRWLAYEDVPYRQRTELRDERIALLDELGFEPRPLRFAAPEPALRRKRSAVACYASQLRAFSAGVGTVFEDEVYWQLTPPRGARNGVRSFECQA